VKRVVCTGASSAWYQLAPEGALKDLATASYSRAAA